MVVEERVQLERQGETMAPIVTSTSELDVYERQGEAVKEDASGLVEGLCETQFNWRAAPGRWSVGQCLEHLNIFGYGTVRPAVDRLIAEARGRGLHGEGPFHYGRLGTWFIRINEPPVKLKARTFKAMMPQHELSPTEVMETFLALQDALIERLEQSAGLDLSAVRARLPPLSGSAWASGSPLPPLTKGVTSGRPIIRRLSPAGLGGDPVRHIFKHTEQHSRLTAQMREDKEKALCQ